MEEVTASVLHHAGTHRRHKLIAHLDEKSKKDKQDSKAYTLFLCGSSGRPSSYGYVKADADSEKPLATTNPKGGARGWESFRLVAAGDGCFRIVSQHDTPWTLGGFDRTQFIILAGKGIIGGTPSHVLIHYIKTIHPEA